MPEAEAIKKIRAELSKRIESYDRLVDSSEFQIDQMMYNEVAHALRTYRDEVKRILKEEGCQDL